MKSFLVVLSIFCFSSIFAQSDFDQRLLEKFSAEQIAQLQENQSPTLDYWTYYLDNSFEIVDAPQGKTVENFGTLRIKSMEEFNILESGINMSRHNAKYFAIKGSDQVLMLMSAAAFTKKYNKYHSK